MLRQRPQGSFIQADFFDNADGLNITDSPFKVSDTQSVSGYNYDYIAPGALRKRNGHTLLNASPDAQLKSLGFALHNTTAGVKTLLRAAGTQLQTVNTSSGATTSVADDTVSASTAPFTSSTQPVVFSQFNTPSLNSTWMAGGGLASGAILGYNGTKSTVNGSASPAGSLSLAASGSDGTLPAGTYYYAVALHKLSTGAISNAALDLSVVVASTNHVTVTLTSITAFDTTKYDLIYIYRSAIAGVSGFTTGDLVTTLASTSTVFTDTGAVQGTAASVPRAGSASLDNSVLPAGTYNTITTFKRRLVTAQGSTLYFSDLNKSESWPTVNTITVPSGGDIKALGIISFNTPTTSAADEFLVVFKERELWIVTGSSVSDWALKFIDYVGCPAQPLIVFANGFLFWMDYRGVYIWDGSGKPIYCSRYIEFDFGPNGDLNLAKLNEGCGTFYRKQNEIIWFLSSSTLGEQMLTLKLDLRRSLPNIQSGLTGRTMDAVFIKDKLSYNAFACASLLPTSSEILYAGGNDGNIWKMFSNFSSDNGAPIAFSYRTRPEDFGLISTTKRFHKVIVWVQESSTNNLTLNYWVNYKTDAANQESTNQQIATRVTNTIWDQSYWDQVYWDSNNVTYTPIVFNLGNSTIGVEGDALTLEFQQNDLSTPLTLGGYSVFYTVAGLRK